MGGRKGSQAGESSKMCRKPRLGSQHTTSSVRGLGRAGPLGPVSLLTHEGKWSPVSVSPGPSRPETLHDRPDPLDVGEVPVIFGANTASLEIWSYTFSLLPRWQFQQ